MNPPTYFGEVFLPLTLLPAYACHTHTGTPLGPRLAKEKHSQGITISLRNENQQENKCR